MSYILIIVVAFVLLRVVGKMLRHFMSPSNVGFWLLILALLFIPHCAWLSLAIIVGRYVVAPITRHLPKDNEKDYSAHAQKSVAENILLSNPNIIQQW